MLFIQRYIQLCSFSVPQKDILQNIASVAIGPFQGFSKSPVYLGLAGWRIALVRDWAQPGTYLLCT